MEKSIKNKSKTGIKSKWVFQDISKLSFGALLAVWRLLGYTGPPCSLVQWEFRQSGSPLLLAKAHFLATGLPISQDASFTPDSTGCWTGSHRTAHGKERPSDTKQRHWRGNCNVREGTWKMKPRINRTLQAMSLCMAVFHFQAFAVQLMSLNKERTSVQNSVN